MLSISLIRWLDTSTARDTVLDTAAALAAERGPASVTMTEVAEKAGIGRATLYKQFPDVQAILTAWHRRIISRHLTQLTEAAARPGTPRQRLQAVLEAFALHAYQRRSHGSELAALLHQGEHVAAAQQQLRELLAGLLAEAAQTGDIRDDIAPGELAGYCLHALTAAGSLPDHDAVHRLVTLTMAALSPPR